LIRCIDETTPITAATFTPAAPEEKSRRGRKRKQPSPSTPVSSLADDIIYGDFDDFDDSPFPSPRSFSSTRVSQPPRQRRRTQAPVQPALESSDGIDADTKQLQHVLLLRRRYLELMIKAKKLELAKASSATSAPPASTDPAFSSFTSPPTTPTTHCADAITDDSTFKPAASVSSPSVSQEAPVHKIETCVTSPPSSMLNKPISVQISQGRLVFQFKRTR